MLTDIYFRDIPNGTIKPSNNSDMESEVDSVTEKVLISDTTSTLFIQAEVRKMTPKLC